MPTQQVAQSSDVSHLEAASQSTAPLFPDNQQFWYETMRAFGAADYGASEFGEVLVTARRIEARNFDSWYDAWNDMGERVAKESADQLARNHKVSARDGFLRASTYYRASEFFLHGNPQDRRIGDAYRKSIKCYLTCAGLYDPPIEPVEIPYEHTSLPGYFHRVDSSGRPRPLIILHTGFDGSAEEMHIEGALGAVERGYNVLAFDGPGQFGPLRREGLHFRPDWEKVVTPVVDFALAQPGVDPKKIVLMGFSLGGYLAPRAAAYEKRIAALIALDGVFDYGATNLNFLPPGAGAAIQKGLQASTAPGIDRAIEAMMKGAPTAQWAITHGMYAMGVSTPSAYIAATLAYTLAGGVAEKISCPTLVCEAEDDLFFKGQPQDLLDHLTCPKTLLRFSRSDGLGDHCQVAGHRKALGRVYDWLDETLEGLAGKTTWSAT